MHYQHSGEEENHFPGYMCDSTGLKEMEGKNMRSLMKVFSEAAFFLGTLAIMYIWLGFLIVTLCSVVNK